MGYDLSPRSTSTIFSSSAAFAVAAGAAAATGASSARWLARLLLQWLCCCAGQLRVLLVLACAAVDARLLDVKGDLWEIGVSRCCWAGAAVANWEARKLCCMMTLLM